MEGPFLYQIVGSVVQTMEEAYPYLAEKQGYVQALVLQEEELFHSTLAAGERRLYELMDASIDKTISGNDAFKLYDTYGFPFELTVEYLSEKGFSVSREEFDRYMEEARRLAKESRKKDSAMASQKAVLMEFQKESEFLYDTYELKSSVIGLMKDEELEKELNTDGFVILKKTCFYAESGGQVSDTGMMVGKNFKARVLDVFKAPNGQHVHKIKLLDGKISMKDDCDLLIDRDRREDIEHNHSSVHILQKVLQEVLSHAVHQSGSYVDSERLRFDFTYTGKIMEEELYQIEERVNEIIQSSLTTITDTMSLEEAKKLGAMALFGEKYKNDVRVVRIGESLELCGGTHVRNTKDINKFAILSCESKGSNVYRIEAVTGNKIENALFEEIKPYNDEMIKLLMKAKTILSAAEQDDIHLVFEIDLNHDKPVSYRDVIYNRNELEYIQSEVRNLEKTYFEMKKGKALTNLDVFLSQVTEIHGVKTILTTVEGYEVAILKELLDNLINQLGKAFLFIAMKKEDGSVNFFARSNTLHAGLIVKEASLRSDGNGGGSNTFAQGGGKSDQYIGEIFGSIKKELTQYES